MILHGIIVLLIFWAIFSRTHRIKADVSAMKQKNDQDHDILAREVLRHREMILRQKEENRMFAEKTDERFCEVEEKIVEQDARIMKLEMQISQCDYDIKRETDNLDQYSKKLAQLDEKLDHAIWEIESWEKQRHIANANEARARKEKIEDEIRSWETKVTNAEKRLDKAQRTKEIYKLKLNEVA